MTAHRSTTTTDCPEFVNYCGEEVMLLKIESTEYGNLAFIQFNNGREDEVPLCSINFLK